MTSKKCIKCGRIKELKDFYTHPQMADGYLNKCKECQKEDNRINRKSKLDYYKKFDRERGNLKHRVDSRKNYQKTEAYRVSHNNASAKWRAKNPEKRKAHNKVLSALRNGTLTKEACGCGGTKVEAHHEDYTKPLDVTWLCSKCHSELRKLG